MKPEYKCPQCGMKNDTHKMDCHDKNRAWTEMVSRQLAESQGLLAGAAIIFLMYKKTGMIPTDLLLLWSEKAVGVSR